MKRYLVFFGPYYYPEGGMNDFIGEVDTIKEGISILDKTIMEGYDSDMFYKQEWIKYQWKMNWAHIYDTQQMKIVWKN